MKKSFSSYVKDYLMLAVLVALIILFSILGPAMANRAFFNFSNLLTMLNQNAYLVILGVGMSIGLFFLLPTLLGTAVTLFTDSMLVRNVAESLLKIVIFVGYLVLCSRMKDIHRVFQYHGAEHKTIFCYEAGLPLTVENVRRQPRHHPRCGTSFLFMVIAISILVSTVVFAIWPVHNPILRFLAHLAMLPLIVGISYEFNRYAGRSESVISRALRWPGLMIQHLTVFEPDDSMIEVAITAMKEVIPDDGSDEW